MMVFPLTELLDEQACYEFLLSVRHPKGLRCPTGHKVAAGRAPHMRDRGPVVDYRCRRCGKVFNVFTDTLWKGTHYSCRQVGLLVRGFAQGGPTLHLTRELGLDYETVLTRRHGWQEQALKNMSGGYTRGSISKEKGKLRRGQEDKRINRDKRRIER